MEHCLVTGSCGFVGNHLCRHLTRLGMRVTGLDVRPGAPVSEDLYDFVQADLVTGEGLARVDWNQFDVVFHLAAAGVKSIARDWQSCIQVNLLGTLHLLSFLESSTRVPALVYTHTFYEDFMAASPALSANPYVMSKYASTQVVRQLARHYQGAIAMAKVYQIYGPGDAPGNLIPYALACLRENKTARLGSGTGLRDWLHVEDLVAGLVASWRSSANRTLREFDLGSGDVVSIRDTLVLLATILNKPTTLLDFDAARDRGDTMAAGKAEHWPDNWRPAFSLEQGLRRLVRATTNDPGGTLSS